MKNTKILYLAKYAPFDQNKNIKNDYVEEYVKYHHELYDELRKYTNVIPSNNFEDIVRYKNEINFIFSVYNKANFKGSEILSSALAEYYNIPYVGANPDIRAIAEDKHIGKMMALHANVPTPKWHVFNDESLINETLLDFEPPFFIKPRFGANSDGIDINSKQENKKGAINKAKLLLQDNMDVIIEECISGVYYTVPAWKTKQGLEVLPSIRQHSENDSNIVTHNQKIYLEKGLSRTFNVNKELHKQLEDYVISMYKLLEPLDYARFDFMVNEKTNEAFFIEVNICCSLSSSSTFAMAAEKKGYTYSDVIHNILSMSFQRQGLHLNSLEDLMG